MEKNKKTPPVTDQGLTGTAAGFEPAGNSKDVQERGDPQNTRSQWVRSAAVLCWCPDDTTPAGQRKGQHFLANFRLT
jgi:hypothetical protein